MFLFKTILPVFAFIFLLTDCQQQSKTVAPASNNDSVPAHPAAPVGLSHEKYDYYHNASARFFDSLLLRHGAFNGSILVAQNDEVVYEKYAGFINPFIKKDSLGPAAAFHLASVSKTFTAMSVLKLWQDGRLGLEDTLGKYFPGFPYGGITVKMLLSHRSGLPNYVHYLERYGWDKHKTVTNQDVLASLYSMHPPIEFVSGKHFSYCNTNYALLALIIEKVSGIRYPDFLQKTIFGPLQMRDSYVFTMKDSARAMGSYEYNNHPFRFEFLDAVYGDKNVYSTVRDMLKWDQALYPGKMFTAATLDSAFAGYSFEKHGQRNYGLGWRMTFLPNGKKLLYHNGWWHGNNTAFIRLVDENAVIIVLGNKFNRRIYSSKYLADLFGNYMQHGNISEDVENPSSGGGETHAARKRTRHRRHR
jgi:CubicO group peptidase (beta-lactamase class C family)